MKTYPRSLVFLIEQARITLEAERLTGMRMPLVVHFDLLQIMACAMANGRKL